MSGGAITSAASNQNPELPIQAAAMVEAADWPFTEVLGVVFSGLGVVLSVLMLLALATALVGRVFVHLEKKKQGGKKVAGPATAAEVSSSANLTPEIDGPLLAVLSAAAFEILERPVRVVKIRKIEPGEADWSLLGRTEIHSSHKLR